MGEPGRLPSVGSHRVGHDRSDLAEACECRFVFFFFSWKKANIYQPKQKLYYLRRKMFVTLLLLNLNLFSVHDLCNYDFKERKKKKKRREHEYSREEEGKGENCMHLYVVIQDSE